MAATQPLLLDSPVALLGLLRTSPWLNSPSLSLSLSLSPSNPISRCSSILSLSLSLSLTVIAAPSLLSCFFSVLIHTHNLQTLRILSLLCKIHTLSLSLSLSHTHTHTHKTVPPIKFLLRTSHHPHHILSNSLSLSFLSILNQHILCLFPSSSLSHPLSLPAMTTIERASSSIESNALLKDLYEKKQNLRRIASEVGSMASELRDVRTRMATQESHLEQETARRQAAEAKAKTMERDLELMHKSLEEKNAHAISTAAIAEQTVMQYLRELVDVRAKLESFQETSDPKAASAVTAQSQCKTLIEELEMKNAALIEHEAYAKKLSQQLLDLQQELQLREGSQMHLKEEVEKMETEMKSAVAKITSRKESELKGSLEDLNMKNAEHLVKHLSVKDEEIVRQREELRLLSAHLKMKARVVEAQMDKHRSADQDLKKKVIKLEFWLQEARTQARKLQRIAERKEKELKDLRAQLTSNATTSKRTSGFWGSPKLKIFMSVSAIALFFFAKR